MSSSASRAARLLRRSSSALSLRRAHSSSAAPSRPPVTLPRFRAGAAAASSFSPSSGITARRFLASNSPSSSSSSSSPSKASADENLVRVIDSEIECIVQSEEGSSAKQIDLPDDFPFEIIDNPGDQSITLKREIAGETIKATVYTNFDTQDLNEDGNDDENNEESFKPAIQMVVTVEKPEISILEFECHFNDNELAIESMRMLDQTNRDAENLYVGPTFQDLDESLQKALHRYLEVRGIKHSLHDWLCEYMMSKDEKEYLVWLKSMKEFVGN